jgi:hypothetical protein
MAKKISNDEKIKAMIRRAINIVADIEEPYRMKAFEVVLSRLWTGSYEKEQGEKVEKPGTLEAKINNFGTKCNLSIDQLKSIYDFKEDKPVFVWSLRGSYAEQHVLISRYLLAAYDEVYGKEWVNLNQVLARDHGISSLGNLSKNLKKHSEIFNLRGQGKAREYKLVDAAKRDTFQMIHDLVGGSNE